MTSQTIIKLYTEIKASNESKAKQQAKLNPQTVWYGRKLTASENQYQAECQFRRESLH